MSDLSLAAALEATIAARKLTGDEHAVLVAHCRSLAKQLDLRPSNSILLRAWMPSLRLLLASGEEPEDATVVDFLRLVSTPSGVAID